MEGMGRALLFVGIAVAIVGLLFMLGPKIPLLGKLPGDLVFRRGESAFYLPLAHIHRRQHRSNRHPEHSFRLFR